ncbi:MAG TPA: ATP-binding protein [Nitrospiraceae bacterium]|nr:ATP-binding protein [Nitrospiraceae bacterium]
MRDGLAFMALRSLHLLDILKAGTLVLLAVLLLSLGSATHETSTIAYLSFFAIMLLQGVEMFYPLLSEEVADSARRVFLLRASILLQLVLASILVAATDGSGSIYELVYLLPIVSAATQLPGREVALAVGSSVLAMVGFILTGEELTASIARVKSFQDAVAAMVYFTMAGLLTYFFAKAERDQRFRYQAMAATLAKTNTELREAQAELAERLAQLTQMEERIQRISQTAALGELAGQVAHEVRNPLGVIKGAAEMLARRVSDLSTSRHLAVILEEVDRLNKGVESILRLGTPLRLHRDWLTLQDLLETATQATAAWSVKGLHRVKLEIPSEPLWIQGDRLLHHALTNLIHNSFQAMPKGGTVTIAARRASGEADAIITISDTGVGLSEEDVKRVGEPFFTKHPGGVGLGFALARRIISEHAGTLEVSSSLGKGTCLTIHLPAKLHESIGHRSSESGKATG